MNKYSIQQPNEIQSVNPYSWYVILVLGLVQMLAALDRNLLSILGEPVKLEFGLSDGQLGFLSGLAFAVPFALAGLPLGLLVDRVNRVRFLTFMLVAWSLLTALCGMARSYVHLILARAGIGAFESGGSPAEMSLLSDYFPPGKLGTAIGWFSLSSPIGMALGFSIGGAIASGMGWRAAFLVVGIPGILLALLIVATVRNPRRQRYRVESEAEERAPKLSQLAGILSQRKPMLLILAAVACLVASHAGITVFLGSFLIRTHGLDLSQVGILIALGVGLGGVCGMPVGGIIGDHFETVSPGGRLIFGAVMMLCAPLPIIAALFTSSQTWFCILLAVYAFFNATYTGVAFASYIGLAPSAARGLCSAALAIVGNLAGYGFGPQLTGLLSDLCAAMSYPSPLQTAMIMTACLYWPAAAFFFLGARAQRATT